MSQFPGQEMVAQYDAALTSAVVFERFDVGIVEAAGPEAAAFLHNLATASVADLAIGDGCPAFFCNARARALFFASVFRLQFGGRDVFWIDAGPGRHEALMAHLDRHLIAEKVELADLGAEWARFHVAGPAANSALDPLLDSPLPQLRDHNHTWRRLAGFDCHIRRVDPLRLGGFDLIVRRVESPAVRNALHSAGFTAAGAETWEVLRVEAGFPEFGREYDENRFVMEVGIPQAVCYTKGCYLGQEPIVMARDRAGFLNRMLCNVRLTGDSAPGQKLTAAAAEIGVLTSTVHSPGFGPIGLAYLRRGSEAPGTEFEVGSGSGVRGAVATTPLRSAPS